MSTPIRCGVGVWMLLLAGCAVADQTARAQEPDGGDAGGSVRVADSAGSADRGPGVSALWGVAGDAWDPSSRLPDFSFAGYHSGEQPIPDVPVVANVEDFGARGDDGVDDTLAIQAAIDATEGGALLIPEGTWVVSRPLRIRKSNLVLRGVGPGRTVLSMVQAVPEDCSVYHENRCVPYGGVAMIDVVPPDFDNREPRGGERIANVTADAERGDVVLRVDSAAAIRPGQLIRLRMTNPGDGSLGCHLYADAGCLNRQRSGWYGGRIVDWTVTVRAVNGDVVTLERPLRIDVREAWRPEIWSFDHPIQEVGLESFTIQFPDEPYGGHHKEEGYYGIYLNAHQSWIRDLEILDADRAIEIQSAFTTVRDLRLGTRFRSGGTTGHYGFQFGGPWTQDNLVENVVFSTDYVHNLSVQSFANGNVYASIEAIHGHLDHHGSAPYENLYTDIELERGEQLQASGGFRRDEPGSGARSTFWNIRKRGGHWTQVRRGGRHPETNLVGIDLDATSRPAAGSTAAWVEAWPGGRAEPSNLYQAQLQRRLGTEQDAM